MSTKNEKKEDLNSNAVVKTCTKCGKTFIQVNPEDNSSICYRCKNLYSKKKEKYCVKCGKKIENIKANRQTYCDECSPQKKKLWARQVSEKDFLCACCGKYRKAKNAFKMIANGSLFVCAECKETKKIMQISFQEPQDVIEYRDHRKQCLKKDPPVLTDQYFLDGLQRLKDQGFIE